MRRQTGSTSRSVPIDRSIDDRLLYGQIFREIHQTFPDFPEITMHIGLVIRRVGNLDDVYLDSAGGEDELDLTELLASA